MSTNERAPDRPVATGNAGTNLQELQTVATTPAKELARERGATLRGVDAKKVPEVSTLSASGFDPNDFDIELGDETMIINMGPQHPSTHGVLRVMMELRGEQVLRTKPVIGYLHTGMEKTAEDLTYVQGGTNVTRMDYLSPFHNELVFSLAAEKLLEIEIPERAIWIRMLMAELNRMSSHLLFQATNGMDLGAVGMMIYGWREREECLSFFEKVTGLRMNHNYIRVGGVAADLPTGWQRDVLNLCDAIEPRLDEYDTLLTGQPIFRDRTMGVGRITADEAIALSATGPILRSTGVEWDLRRHMPYMFYDQLDFDVIVGTHGDAFDRFAIRLNEIRESIRIVRQIVDLVPEGPYRVQDKKVTPPPRSRIDESMEALIHHFKLFTEGFRVPEGEVYVAIESPRGELGCYMVSDGANKPYRMHVRGPSFVNLQSMPTMMQGAMIADAIAIISSIDPVLGEVDKIVARFNAVNLERAKELLGHYPRPKSATVPLCHLAQEQDGYLTNDAMEHIAELVGVSPAEVYGTASFYEMFKFHPVGKYVIGVCTNISCMILGGEELLEHCERKLGIRAGATTSDGLITLEEMECLAACTRAPCLQVNYRYFENVTHPQADTLIDDLRAGKKTGDIPPHGTLARPSIHPG